MYSPFFSTRPPSPGAPPPGSGSSHPNFLERRRYPVLVVEDNAAKRYAIARGLRAGGFVVQECGSAREALELFRSHAALVLDVHLPDMDGFDLCRTIRDSAPEAVIVQVSSVMVDEEYKRAGLAAGADAYLTEADAAQLLATLDRLLLSE